MVLSTRIVVFCQLGSICMFHFLSLRCRRKDPWTRTASPDCYNFYLKKCLLSSPIVSVPAMRTLQSFVNYWFRRIIIGCKLGELKLERHYITNTYPPALVDCLTNQKGMRQGVCSNAVATKERKQPIDGGFSDVQLGFCNRPNPPYALLRRFSMYHAKMFPPMWMRRLISKHFYTYHRRFFSIFLMVKYSRTNPACSRNKPAKVLSLLCNHAAQLPSDLWASYLCCQ
jgi:hypothetical protein